MVVGSEKIKQYIDSGVIDNASPDRIQQVSYDLTTKSFHYDEKPLSRVELKPGDSVFVASKEIINLPSDLTASVLLRNSRIREGLSLDAPLYMPGHRTTVFYRVTNFSGNVIILDANGKGIAQLVFSPISGKAALYSGNFSDEIDFSGLGKYRDVYEADIQEVEKKADEVKGIEKRMYGNVLALMAIFAAIFTLVNVNIQASSWDLGRIVVINLATVGSFAMLSGFICLIVRPEKRSVTGASWAAALLAYIAAALIAVIG